MNAYRIECLAIENICEKYGYGNVMEWASALWRFKAKKESFPVSGCFVPTCPNFIKEEYRCPSQQALYDKLVENIKIIDGKAKMNEEYKNE